jgi:fatty acid/phospholipid biosynthesis enzyme
MVKNYNMEKLIEDLSKYGKVISCKQVHEDVITILITDGFSGNVVKTMECMTLITNTFPEYPKLETWVTDDNLCFTVLKK